MPSVPPFCCVSLPSPCQTPEGISFSRGQLCFLSLLQRCSSLSTGTMAQAQDMVTQRGRKSIYGRAGIRRKAGARPPPGPRLPTRAHRGPSLRRKGLWQGQLMCSASLVTFHVLSRPLHIAARNGLKLVVEELLAKGACVLAVDENGKWTSFAVAAGTFPCWSLPGDSGG